MATIRLTPSTYYSSSAYLSVSNESNMYSNTDSTNYATITNTRSGTSSYYIYIRGFNFDDVPSLATVNSITIKLKAYQSGGNTGTISCYDGTTAVSTAGSTTALGTSATVQTFTSTTVNWNTLKSYGSDFGIRINCRRSNRNTTSYVYIYGVEIVVDYTVPMKNLTITNNSSTVTTNPPATTTVPEGEDLDISFYNIASLDSVQITDNNNDIKSSLLHYSAGTSNNSIIPGELIDSSGTVTNPNNGLTNHTSTTYAQTNGQSQHFLLYKFNVPTVPPIATNISVSCTAKVQHTRSTASGQVQLYSENTAKGSVSTFGNTTTTVNLTTGTWTASELNDVRIRIGNSYTGGTTTYETRFYGATLTISYTVANEVYIYTIPSITSDHVIVIRDVSSAGLPIRVKQNGTWVTAKKLFIKQNGSWVQSTTIKVKNNGTWK